MNIKQNSSQRNTFEIHNIIIQIVYRLVFLVEGMSL